MNFFKKVLVLDNPNLGVIYLIFVMIILLSFFSALYVVKRYGDMVPKKELIERGIGYSDEEGNFQFYDVFKFAE